MDNLVLLARPSFFIVNEMQGLMKQNGYNPIPVKNLSAIESAPSGSVSGAVISTAVRSDVPESYSEVLQQMRSRHRNIPVMFATLVDFDMMAKAIRLKLEDIGLQPNLMPISRETLHSGQLGDPNTFIIIHKDDITDEQRYPITQEVLRRHFN